MLDFLYNRTGIGRLAQEIRLRWSSTSQAKLQEEIDVRRMIRSRYEPEVQARWAHVFRDLDTLYGIADERGLPVVLLLFPFTFQLHEPELQWPQRALRAHAATHNVRVIDYTGVFETLTAEDTTSVAHYFLDEDHYTARGHRVVADTLSVVIRDLIENGEVHRFRTP